MYTRHIPNISHKSMGMSGPQYMGDTFIPFSWPFYSWGDSLKKQASLTWVPPLYHQGHRLMIKATWGAQKFHTRNVSSRPTELGR